jgi:hypothetical protein
MHGLMKHILLVHYDFSIIKRAKKLSTLCNSTQMHQVFLFQFGIVNEVTCRQH